MPVYVNINNSVTNQTGYDALYGSGTWLTKDGSSTKPYVMVDYTGVLSLVPSGEYLFSGIYVSNSPDPMAFDFGYFKSIGSWGNLPFRIKKENGYISIFGTTPDSTISGAILYSEYGLSLYVQSGPPNTLNFYDSVLYNNWLGEYISFGQEYDSYLERVRFYRCSLYGSLNFKNSNRTVELYSCFHSGSFENTYGGTLASTTITAQNSTFTESDFGGRTEFNCWGNTFNSSVIPSGEINLTGSVYALVTETGISPLWAYSGYYLYFVPDVPSGANPLTVGFNAYTNVSGITYSWLAESSTYSGNPINHTFSDAGTYLVSLSGNWGASGYTGYDTYIFDNFSSGFMDDWWNSDTKNWYGIQSTSSGNALQYSGSASENMRMLTPYGVYLSGDFDVAAMFFVSGTINYIWPSIGILTTSGDTGLEGEHWTRQGYDTLYEVAELHVAGSGHVGGLYRCDLESYQVTLGYSPQLTYNGNGRTVGVRLIRDNGVISGYYKDGTGAWTSVSGSVNYSGNAVLELNGSSWTRCLWISGGADGGFPYYVSGYSIYKSSAVPDWPYLSSYMYDSFASSGFSPYWDDDFTGTNIGDASGYYAYAGGNYDDVLIPSGGGATICGDFDLQLDFVLNSGVQANESLHLYLKDSDGNLLNWVDWAFGNLTYRGGSAISAPSYSAHGRKITTRMTRGYYLDSIGNAYLETPNSGIHTYYLDNWSGGATNQWKEWTGSPYSDSNTYDCFYILVNGANLNGFDNFKLQAESGLPFSSEAIETYIGEIATPSGSLAFSDYIVVYLPSTVITGLVEGAGFINSFPNFVDNVEGELYGLGYVGGVMSFYYPPSPEPPTSSGLLKKGIKPMLTNKSRYPYKRPSDVIVSKIDFLKNGRLSYLSGIPVELWMNYSGEWAKVEDGLTDRYGSCYITHPTSGITNITNCLGVVKATYDGADYVSNVMRYNFYSGLAVEEDLVYIIDAAPTGLALDRLNHDIFDGSGRINYFDRMYYV